MNNEENSANDLNEVAALTEETVFKSRYSAVVSKKGNKQRVTIGVIVLIVSLILVLMLTGNKKPIEPVQDNEPSADTSLVLQQNAQRLAALRNIVVQPPIPSSQLQLQQVPEVDKALLERQNAPTQMYEAPHSPVSVAASTGSTTTQTLTGNSAFTEFANAQNNSAPLVTGQRIAHPNYTVAQGDFIYAVLETAIDSDLPGMVRAVVAEPVYAYSGSPVLIPAGSRLIGQYDTDSSNGLSSNRIFVMWNRVITPQGVSIMINSPSSDVLGRAGQGADSTDTHFFSMFGTASLLSVIGATTSTVGVGSYDQPNSANQYRTAVGNAFQNSAQNAMSSNLKIKPTLHVHQGDAINVFVARDVDLYSILGSHG